MKRSLVVTAAGHNVQNGFSREVQLVTSKVGERRSYLTNFCRRCQTIDEHLYLGEMVSQLIDCHTISSVHNKIELDGVTIYSEDQVGRKSMDVDHLGVASKGAFRGGQLCMIIRSSLKVKLGKHRLGPEKYSLVPCTRVLPKDSRHE